MTVTHDGSSRGILRLLAGQPVVEKLLDRGNLNGVAHNPLRQIRRELLDLDGGHLPRPTLGLASSHASAILRASLEFRCLVERLTCRPNELV